MGEYKLVNILFFNSLGVLVAVRESEMGLRSDKIMLAINDRLIFKDFFKNLIGQNGIFVFLLEADIIVHFSSLQGTGKNKG